MNRWINNTIWSDDQEIDDINTASHEVEEFYESLKSGGKAGIEVNDVKLCYRDNQHKFSRDVMRAIRDNQILLIQAGVGIGKSMGYLIPIFSTFKNSKKFDTVVISTSTIGLQQQLLSDIENISKVLEFDIKPVIAKGINNYLCLARLKSRMMHCSQNEKLFLEEIEKTMRENKSADRDKLIDINDELWNSIRLNNRGFCSNCSYSKNCLYKDVSKNVSKASIIITNHGHLAKSVLDDRDFVQNADMFVIDEAHKLEDSIRNIDTGFIEKKRVMDILYFYLNNKDLNDKEKNNMLRYIDCIDKFFDKLYKRGEGFYYNNRYAIPNGNKINITDYNKIPIYFERMDKVINPARNGLNNIIYLV